jgi:TetR/AcrR family transcriptional regulator
MKSFTEGTTIRRMKRTEAHQVLSRKEREKLSHHQDILNAARELFAEKGYHDTTLEEIARHAEFSKGTIYNYFSSKDELFYGIIDQVLDEIRILAHAAVTQTIGGAREKMAAYAKEMISYSQTNSDLFRLIIREMTRRDWEGHDIKVREIKRRAQKTLEIIAGPLDEEIRAKKLRPFEALQLAALFNSTLHFYCMHLLSESQALAQTAIDDVVAFVVTVFFDGLTQGKLKG